MQSSEFANGLAPFALLINKSALSPAYRALNLASDFIKGCSAFGIMKYECQTGLKQEVMVDGDSFINVIKSLPSGELELVAKGNTLDWKCGRARGKFALLQEDIAMPEIDFDLKDAMEVPASFSKSLELGALSCGSTAFLSIGLYGVVLSARDDSDSIWAYSSDNTTVASCELAPALSDAPLQATISPDAVKLLVAVSGRKQARLSFDAETVYCQTPNLKLLLKQIAPLKHDIAVYAAMYNEDKSSVPLNRDTIAAFIRRAQALAETKVDVNVEISVSEGATRLSSEGATRLSFDEGKAMSEEFYLVENASDLVVPPIKLEAARLAKALAYSTTIGFDYAEKKVLVLRGANNFAFVISGKTQAE